MLEYSLIRSVEPAIEPVTLSEAKRHANVVASDDDALIAALIQAAREQVESDASRALITQTWRLKLHEWFAYCLEMPRPPLQSVTSIVYLDQNDAVQTMPAAYYDVDADRTPGVIWKDPDYTWPMVSDQANAITIVFKAGYGDAAAAVPARAKQAILLLVGHWYRCREAVGTVGQEVALAYQRLTNSLRVGNYP
jgi:uncharacterized phiE125 gp8 family phage protein